MNPCPIHENRHPDEHPGCVTLLDQTHPTSFGIGIGIGRAIEFAAKKTKAILILDRVNVDPDRGSESCPFWGKSPESLIPKKSMQALYLASGLGASSNRCSRGCRLFC